MNERQAARNAMSAIARQNAAARSAALSHRSREASGMGNDFGFSFGADGEGLWPKIKRFFGFGPKGIAAFPALPAGANEVAMAAAANYQMPQRVAPGTEGAVYVPNPIEDLPVEHVMILEGAPNDLVNAINAHAVALPAKISDLQANPTPAKLQSVQASALRLQGQNMLLAVSSLPPAAQNAARAAAQSLLNQAAGLDAMAKRGGQ